MAWHDLFGVAGISLVICAYYLLQTDRLSLRGAKYSILNIAGACLIMISLIFNFNFSAFIIELFWFIIGIIGLFQSRKTGSVMD